MPPHNLQAEESLLGAMLLSRDAIAAASELLSADDFYKPAHGHIYDAITTLNAAGEPADPVTVADELRRAGLLEAIGGPAALVNLQVATPATSNAGRYAKIIEEHALLRRLIGVAGEIAEMGYDLPDDVTKTVDRAESHGLRGRPAPRHRHHGRRSTTCSTPTSTGSSSSTSGASPSPACPPATPTSTSCCRACSPTPCSCSAPARRPARPRSALGMATHAALEANRPVLSSRSR